MLSTVTCPIALHANIAACLSNIYAPSFVLMYMWFSLQLVFLMQIQIVFNKAMTKCFADYKCLQAMESYKEEMIHSLNLLAELVTSPISFQRAITGIA